VGTKTALLFGAFWRGQGTPGLSIATLGALEFEIRAQAKASGGASATFVALLHDPPVGDQSLAIELDDFADEGAVFALYFVTADGAVMTRSVSVGVGVGGEQTASLALETRAPDFEVGLAQGYQAIDLPPQDAAQDAAISHNEETALTFTALAAEPSTQLTTFGNYPTIAAIALQEIGAPGMALDPAEDRTYKGKTLTWLDAPAEQEDPVPQRQWQHVDGPFRIFLQQYADDDSYFATVHEGKQSRSVDRVADADDAIDAAVDLIVSALNLSAAKVVILQNTPHVPEV
jgi:hypothetical protein